MIDLRRPSRSSGFSLLEVLVAFAVLSISLTAILSIYSAVFRSSGAAQSYMVATQLVEAKLKEIIVSNEQPIGMEGGTLAEQYTWRATVRALDWRNSSDLGEHPLEPFEVSVRVSWTEAGRDHEVSLSTVRLANAQ